MEEENEKVVEETTQETTEKVEESKFESAGDDSIIKVDLSKPPEPKQDEVKEDNANDSGVAAELEDAEPTQEQEEVQPEAETQEAPVLEEITEDEEAVANNGEVEEIATEAEEAIKENLETGKPLPENVQKLIDFMEDTGGDLADYVKLNQDYSKLDDRNLLYEFYKQTKPHLDNEEITFLMNDSFAYDEEVDEEIDIKRKKLALKEQVANAKSHLDGRKSKYYKEIKAGSKLTEDQQKAIDFFNRHNEESEVIKKTAENQRNSFIKQSDSVFNDKFKGFEYNVGDKKYRFNVNNVDDVKESQSDISNFTKKFLDKKNSLIDPKGYHKSLYTAMNADAVAKHFYEQGKADAIKNSIAKGKNVSMNPRQSHGVVEAGGVKVRVLGESSSDFKFKIKNKNK